MNLEASLEAGVPVGRSRRSMPEIAADICADHHIGLVDLIGPSRLHAIVCARQHFMALAYQQDHLSLAMIGKFLGGRNHATVLHGLRAHATRDEGPPPTTTEAEAA